MIKSFQEQADYWKKSRSLFNFASKYFFAIAAGIGLTAWPALTLGQDASLVALPTEIHSILTSVCADCHSPDAAEANVRFDNFATLKIDAQLELLNRVQDQLFFGLMPPEDAQQLAPHQHGQMTHWLRTELRLRGASKLDEKLRDPAYGNYVEHTKLFDGSVSQKPFTPARRWLVSPQIFHQQVNDIFGLTDGNRQNSFYGVTNPFVLPDRSGVRDYDIAWVRSGSCAV